VTPTNPIVARYDADAADYLRHWAPVLEETARRLLDYVEPFVARRGGRVRVLEVGAGTGTLLLSALERWPLAGFVATEPARGMLDLARQRVQAARPGETRVEFVEGHADALPVDPSSIDLVISSFVLQLVPDRLAALREAGRVLGPGGLVSYVTWLDRDSRQPFTPAEEFDEAVYDLEIEEPEGTDEPHAGDVRSGRTATDELRRAGFVRASATEEELIFAWTFEGYLDYKLAYDERWLMESLTAAQRKQLEKNARDRLGRLKERDFRWHAPVVFARASRSKSELASYATAARNGGSTGRHTLQAR
jgi:SAM-dependent methyltransferase